MLKNVFKTAVRALLRNKTYSFLNIFGLAVGIACTGLIFLWVEDEMNYDTANIKKDDLYQVLNNWPYPAHYSTFETTPGPLAPAIKAEIPGVANTARCTYGRTNALFTIGDKQLYAGGVFADSTLFSMLTIPFTQGNARSAFTELYSMVITEKTAIKLFGETANVVGKTVKVDNKADYIITGVIKDFPQNTTLQYEWIAPFDIAEKNNGSLRDWASNDIITLVELKTNAGLEKVTSQLEGLIRKRVPGSIASSMLFSMNDWHLRHDFENGRKTGKGRIQYVRMFMLIAWIILFLACINFMNLATARSEKRAREVGVRKVLGSGKKTLIAQFIGEAMFMSLLAVMAAILIIVLALPAFNMLTEKNLSVNLGSPLHVAVLLAITVVCGLVAGSYPSFYLSSFNPVFVLKGLKVKAGSAGLIRKGLVITQFTVSIVLIVSTIIIFQQIQHVKNRDAGYDKNGLLKISLQGDLGKNFEVVKQHLLGTGMIENAALTGYDLLNGGGNWDGFDWKGKTANEKYSITYRNVSPELLNTYGIQLLQGRDFSSNPVADTANIIINESLAQMLHGKSPIGEIIRTDGNRSYTVIGVVKNFVFSDMYGKPDPVIFFCQPHNEWQSYMYVRLKKNVDLEQAVAEVEATIKKDNPAYPVDYRFVDEEFNKVFLSEMLVSKLSRVFAALAIIISCLGLFGLAAYTAERRVKEIGIRKVLGASVTGLAGLLSTEFIKLVIVSIVLACPIAWYAMSEWLQNYAYHVSIQWWVFATAGSAAIVIALITVSFQSIKAAMMNPVKAIKAE
jgi:putative ABC transport system permease protein